MSNDLPEPAESRPRGKNRRLRLLVAINAVVLAVYLLAQVDQSTAEKFGRVGLRFYDLFHPTGRSTSRTAQRFADDVRTLGGAPNVRVIKPGFLGVFGREEWFNVSVRKRTFDDKALARLADTHGDQIRGLELINTAVSDAGLQHLKKMTNLRHLLIRNYAPTGQRKMTEAGLVHIAALTQLSSLNLSDLPITDAGLDALKDLPDLTGLYFSHTQVQGPALAKWKSLPRLLVIYLDGSKISEDGLRALSGATSLQILSLSGVPLTTKALPLLKAMPHLEQLEITGCGFLDEEIDALQKSKPELRIVR